MTTRVETITVRRVKYLVERWKRSDRDALDIRFILHGPTRDYWVVASEDRRDRLIVRCPTQLSAFRLPPRHLIGVWFAEDQDGKLILAPKDS